MLDLAAQAGAAHHQAAAIRTDAKTLCLDGLCADGRCPGHGADSLNLQEVRI
jgi:hypothetical protein